MVRKANEMESVFKNLRNGKGMTELINFISEEESYGAGRLFALTVIQPGGSIGYHKHEGEFELYYMLEGRGKVLDNETEFELLPGDIMLCKDGESHTIENESDSDLKFLSIILYNPQEK